MAKLVILNQGMTGRAFDLVAERTTVGRVEDNTFQIGDPSVSSHHCEIQLRGADIVIRDLNSTNGSFINDARITESILKPGQTLRLGQVELKLEPEGGSVTAAGVPAAPPVPGTSTAAPAAPAAPPPAPKKQLDATMVIPRGVSLDQLEQGGRRPGFDTSSTVFKKKRNKTGQYFWIAAGIGILLIIVLIVVVLSQTKH
jgi:predicted component of type VI protein secretion system